MLHTPISIPYHWKQEIKESLDDDVQKGIIEPLPIGKSVEWFSHMILVTKKGKPRHTIDPQKLNAHCYRKIHHFQSPFQQECQIPSNTKKTGLDAVNGFHTIELDKASHKLTNLLQNGKDISVTIYHKGI